VLVGLAVTGYVLTYLAGWIAGLDTTEPSTEGWSWAVIVVAMLCYLVAWCLVWVAVAVAALALVVRATTWAVRRS
jgi:hypothetical protein